MPTQTLHGGMPCADAVAPGRGYRLALTLTTALRGQTGLVPCACNTCVRSVQMDASIFSMCVLAERDFVHWRTDAAVYGKLTDGVTVMGRTSTAHQTSIIRRMCSRTHHPTAFSSHPRKMMMCGHGRRVTPATSFSCLLSIKHAKNRPTTPQAPTGVRPHQPT